MNAKLSDYGIACFATASGLTQSVGTAGYRAPELLLSSTSSMPYYHKVWARIQHAIFSQGMESVWGEDPTWDIAIRYGGWASSNPVSVHNFPIPGLCCNILVAVGCSLRNS